MLDLGNRNKSSVAFRVNTPGSVIVELAAVVTRIKPSALSTLDPFQVSFHTDTNIGLYVVLLNFVAPANRTGWFHSLSPFIRACSRARVMDSTVAPISESVT